jgi:uncharacterized protein (DUF927 family)
MNEAVTALIQGDAVAFVAACAADSGFPLEDETLGALKVFKKENPAGWERVYARLKAETDVRLGELERLMKAGNGAAAPSEEPVFTMTENGLWARDDLNRFIRLAQYFEVLGYCRSVPDQCGRTNDWGLFLYFCNRDGVVREELVSIGRLHGDLGLLCADLGLAGMDIEGDERPRKLFRKYLLTFDTKDRITLVPRTGWHTISSQLLFVLPGETISADPLPERVVLTVGGNRVYGAAGTLADWQESVGWMARGHFLARLTISAALAGPLLRLGGYEGGGVHIYGDSGVGKTTVTRMGASIWRPGANLPSWRATANGLEGAFARASDANLVLDEIGQASSIDVAAVCYMATGTIGKQRMRSDTSLRDPLTWLLLFLSSGEMPLEAKLSESGRKPRAGQLVRLLDVKANRVNGAFDELPEGTAPHLFALECERAASTYYGTAGPEFVRLLLENEIGGDAIRALVDKFVTEVLPEGTAGAGQAARAAQRFGLIAAAGELATELGILPWESNQATEAALWAFGQWRTARGGVGSYERMQAIAHVKLYVQRYGASRFDPLGRPEPPPKPGDTSEPVRAVIDPADLDGRRAPDRAGYHKGSGDDERWYIFPEVWAKEVCGGLDHAFVARALKDEDMLEPGDGKNLTKKVKIHGHQYRFYVLKPKILEGAE